METAVSFVSLFRLSHKTDIMLLMSLWPISVLPFDICPTETKTFAQKETCQTSFYRHPFCGLTNMYKNFIQFLVTR